jgi:hypothetical protein
MKQCDGNKKDNKDKCLKKNKLNPNKNDSKQICTWCGKSSKDLCCSYECNTAYYLIMG